VVNPGAHIAGSVRVGFGSVVSMGASVVQGRRVGRNAVIAAGAVVLEDVPDRALVAGVPAVVKRIS
jgi:acetyltransferase-like isoleucine patch superfamily enzyme